MFPFIGAVFELRSADCNADAFVYDFYVGYVW